MNGQLGITLKAERGKRGLSQRGLAELAGLPPTTVRDIESGKVNTPRPATLLALAQALDLPLEYLSGQSPREGMDEVITLPAGEVGRLLVEYSRLSLERRALALNLIRTLREEQAP